MPRLLLFLLWMAVGCAETTTLYPYDGVTLLLQHDILPRELGMSIILVDLMDPGIRFKVTPPGGTRETVRKSTAEFLFEEKAQIAINAHFFLPYPSEDIDTFLIGLAASEGHVYSDFEEPLQSYAILPNAPALNLDRENRPSIVRPGDSRANLWNVVSGSAQIVTDGVKTIPEYAPYGPLVPGGPQAYSNADSWYQRRAARTAIGITRDNKTLVLFIADSATVDEVADRLVKDYGVWNALNLDGGGSTSMVIEDLGAPLQLSGDPQRPQDARAVGSSLAVFANPRK